MRVSKNKYCSKPMANKKTKAMKKSFFSILILVVLVLSCDKKDDAPQPDVEEYNVSVTFDNSQGNVIIEPNKKTYTPGEVVTLKIAPNEGYMFSNWEGQVAGEDINKDEISFTIESDIDVKAIFKMKEANQFSLDLTVNESEGEVSVTPEKSIYLEGDKVTLKATPAEGYIFSEWTGTLTGNQPEMEIQMDKDHEITAVFKKVDATSQSSFLMQVNGEYNLDSKMWDFNIRLEDKVAEISIIDATVKINDTELLYDDSNSTYSSTLDSSILNTEIEISITHPDVGTLNYPVLISAFPSGEDGINFTQSEDGNSISITWADLEGVDAYLVRRLLRSPATQSLANYLPASEDSNNLNGVRTTNSFTTTFNEIWSSNTSSFPRFNYFELRIHPLIIKKELERLHADSYIIIEGRPTAINGTR